MKRTNHVSNVNRQIAGTPVWAGARKLLLGWLASVLTIAILITSMGHGLAFAADGDLDPTFSGDGKVTTDFGTEDYATAVTMQADGKIVAVGPGIPTGGSLHDFALARYNPDGSLDPTFSGDGKVTTDFGGRDTAGGVAVQADGKIVVAGVTGPSNGPYDFALARYNANGSLDNTFSGDGLVTTNFTSGSSDQATSVAITANGQIVAAGMTGPDNGPYNFAVARYNSNGTLDTGFGFGGKIATDFGGEDQAYDIALVEDGKIVLAGTTNNGSGVRDFALARYNSNGSLDSNFSGDGKVTTNFTGNNADIALGVEITSDGKIVAAGQTGLDGLYDFALARYNPDGSLDTSFSGDGKVTTGFASGYDDGAGDIAIQADGKIVAAGYTTSDYVNLNRDFALTRYLPNGTLDTSFSFDGMVATDFGGNVDIATEMVIGADGKIVVAGLVTFGSNNLFAVARYLSSGTPTPTPTSTSAPTQTPGGPTATSVAATPTPGTCPIQFTDVPVDHTFYTHIRCLACRNILGGYSDGTFRPGSDITRGQIAKIVSNAAGYADDVTGRQTYTDVPSSQTFWLWIERLSLHGVMGGYNCGGTGEPCDPENRPYFRPGSNATRGQLSKIVSNAAGYSETQTGQTYEDVPITNAFHLWIERLSSRGILGGYNCGGTGEPCVPPGNKPYFRPGSNVTRGQASKIVTNTFYPACVTP